MHEQTSDPDDPDYVTIRFALLKTNNDLLWTVAAAEGESFTVTLNRAVGLYEILHRAEPGNTVSWKRGDGTTRRALILTENPTSVVLVNRNRWSDAHLLLSAALIFISLFNLRGNLFWLFPFVVGMTGLWLWAWRKV